MAKINGKVKAGNDRINMSLVKPTERKIANKQSHLCGVSNKTARAAKTAL